MKKAVTFFICFFIVAWQCGGQNWVPYATYPGPTADLGMLSFQIGTKIYAGLGYDNGNGGAVRDFWELDTETFTPTWTKIADYPGIITAETYGGYGVGFSIGNLGYVGLWGTNDFWEYNPSNNTWTQRQSFPGGNRQESATFVINEKGYVFGGTENPWDVNTYHRDLWEYSPVTDQWTQRTDLPAGQFNERAGAFGFALFGNGYIAGGYQHRSFDPILSDLWKYDPASDEWTLENVLPDTGPYTAGLAGCATATTCDRAYIFLGKTYDGDFQVRQRRFWSYDPVTNTFTRLSDYPDTQFNLSSKDGFYISGKVIGGCPNYKSYNPWPIQLSGPDLVCSNGQFTANNVPLGATISWSKSSNLNYVSGQGTTAYTVSKASDGPGWVNAMVTRSCGEVLPTVGYTFQVGKYVPNQYPIDGPSSVLCWQEVVYSGPELAYATYYDWTWPPNWTYVSGQGTQNLRLNDPDGSGYIILSVDNDCGSGTPTRKWVTVSCSNVFSNPASDELIVSFDSEPEPATSDDESELIYEARLYNSSQNLVYSTTTSEKTITIPTSEFPDGAYVLNLIINGEVIQKQVYISK